MRHSLATDGYHGSGLATLLAKSAAPKGVLYHHFPGGKRDLAIATIEQEVEYLASALSSNQQNESNFVQKISYWFESAYLRLEAAQFQMGCPLAGSAHNIQTDDEPLRTSLAGAFDTVRNVISRELSRSGLEQSVADNWAHALISTYEGGLLLARTARSGLPLRASMSVLLPILAAEIAKTKGRHD
jgi:TetR/AcrR family transcriptional regulator, lmrAB and yxaGH operons repressor